MPVLGSCPCEHSPLQTPQPHQPLTPHPHPSDNNNNLTNLSYRKTVYFQNYRASPQVLSAVLWFRDGLSTGVEGSSLSPTVLEGRGGIYSWWWPTVLRRDFSSSHRTWLVPETVWLSKGEPGIFYTLGFPVSHTGFHHGTISHEALISDQTDGVTQPATSRLNAAK